MHDDAEAGLAARVARLEQENEALRSLRRPARGRTAAVVALVLVGVLLAPVAVVAGWARVTVTDTDRFVATYAPLARDPAVQAYLTDQVVTVIEQQVGIDRLTADLVDGVVGLGTGPRATAALQALQGPLTQAVDSLLRSRTATFIGSEAFATVWRETLRVAHAQAVGTLSGAPDALVVAGSTGTLSIQLRPIVAAVRDRLVAQGIALAARVPDVDRQIPLTTSAAVPRAMVAYQVVLAAGAWLPPVALALVLAGVLLSSVRRRTGSAAALSLAAAMGLLLGALAIGRTLVTTQAAADVPADLVRAGYATATSPMVGTAQAVLVLGLVVAAATWVHGPAGAARWLREVGAAATARAGSSVVAAGVRPGPVAGRVAAGAGVLRALALVAGSLVILLVRPVSVGLVLGVSVSVVVVILAVDLTGSVVRVADAGRVPPEDL